MVIRLPPPPTHRQTPAHGGEAGKEAGETRKVFREAADAGGFYFNARQYVGGCVCNNKGTCGLCLFVDEPEADVEAESTRMPNFQGQGVEWGHD